jgi:hypothetical protein
MSEGITNEIDVFAELSRHDIALPFVQHDEGQLNWWAPIDLGGIADEIEHGELLATLALSAAKAVNEPVIIGLVLRDLARSVKQTGRWGGIESGFAGKIAMAAYVGAMN